MTPEQSLVQQIQQTLNAEQLERNPNLEDLALQFAELCIAANNRLANCADFISKGRRSEAVHEAHNLPARLRDTCREPEKGKTVQVGNHPADDCADGRRV